MLGFLAAVILAGVIVAFGEAGTRGCRAIFERIAGKGRGEEFTTLFRPQPSARSLRVWSARCPHPGPARRPVPASRKGAVRGRLGGNRPGPGHCASARSDRLSSRNRIHLDPRRIWQRRGDRLYGPAACGRNGGQRSQTAVARPRCRRTDANNPRGCAGRHGSHGHCRNVRWGNTAGVGLSGVYELGQRDSGLAGGPEDTGAVKRRCSVIPAPQGDSRPHPTATIAASLHCSQRSSHTVRCRGDQPLRRHA